MNKYCVRAFSMLQFMRLLARGVKVLKMRGGIIAAPHFYVVFGLQNF